MTKKKTNEDTNMVELEYSLQKQSFDELLGELGAMKLRLGVIIPIIFEKGKAKGLNDIEIRDKIKKMIDIPERTLNPYLPKGAKRHNYPRTRKLAEFANYNQERERPISTNYPIGSFEESNDNDKKDIENGKQDVNKGDDSDEDKMSSEASITYDENNQIVQIEILKKLQDKIANLEAQLNQEQIKNEDLSIQIKNAVSINTQLRSQLQAAQDNASTLLISREKFPPNFGQVFESQDHVFVIEFRGTKVLDISVITGNHAIKTGVNNRH